MPDVKARVVVQSSGVLNVHVAPEVLYSLAATQQVTKAIMAKTGHPNCCSGFQLVFKLEEVEFGV